MARRAVSMLAYAVMSTTATCGQRSFTCASSVRPSGGAIRRSVMTASKRDASSRCSAVMPPFTNSVSWLASRSASAVSSAFRISSSTTKTRTSAPDPSAGADRHPRDAGRAATQLAADDQIAARRRHQPTRQEQAQARARDLRRDERLAELLQHVLRNTLTLVGDLDLEPTAPHAVRHRETAAARHRLDGVEQQIEVHLLERLG